MKQQVLLRECSGAFIQQPEDIGNTVIADAILQDKEYPFLIGDYVNVADGNYLVGYTEVQIGVENKKVWYKEGFVDTDDLLDLISELNLSE